MPNGSCRRHEDREVGCRRGSCDYDDKRHSCSGSSRSRECGNNDERCGRKDHCFDDRALNFGSRNAGPARSPVDCPRLREKSAESTCTCKRSTSHRDKTDCRTFSVVCDRRSKNGFSSDYRRSAEDFTSQSCKLDGAVESSRGCCRCQQSSIKCTSRENHKCGASRTTPLPAVYENLGGGLNCRRCEGKVYHAEMQLVSGAAYHRICFSCFCCRKLLEPFTYQEHCREVFCKQCYTRNYGPQGYGYGMGAGVLQTPL